MAKMPKEAQPKKDKSKKVMSPVAKSVINIIVLFFAGLGIYFKITNATAQGKYVSKYGDWHQSTIGANSLFLFALIFLGLRIMMMDRFNKDK